MTRCMSLLHNAWHFTGTLLTLLVDVVRFLRLCLRPPAALAAENLFLRKQLALYQERHSKPRRATDATRLALVWLARWFDWRQDLANVTAHPTASWTFQQLREAIPTDHPYRFLIYDRDSIFTPQLDQSIGHLGLRVLKTPPQSPPANALTGAHAGLAA